MHAARLHVCSELAARPAPRPADPARTLTDPSRTRPRASAPARSDERLTQTAIALLKAGASPDLRVSRRKEDGTSQGGLTVRASVRQGTDARRLRCSPPPRRRAP